MGIWWNPWEVILHNFVMIKYSISAEFHFIGTKIRGCLTNFYGPFKFAQKHAFIESLTDIKEWVVTRHWMVGGDFNLIKFLKEKKGCQITLGQISETFSKKIYDLDLVDVITTNSLYTWSNQRSGDRNIASHLDRFMLSECILIEGGDLAALVLPTAGSDHWSISLEWRPGENLW